MSSSPSNLADRVSRSDMDDFALLARQPSRSQTLRIGFIDPTADPESVARATVPSNLAEKIVLSDTAHDTHL